MDRELRWFTGLAYAITWLTLGPWFYWFNRVWKRQLPGWAWVIVPIAFLGGYGPSLSAIYLTARAGGRQALRNLLRKLAIWRVHAGWYLFVLILPIALTAIATALSPGRQLIRDWHFMPAFLSSPTVLLGALLFGPLGEELGWRGYALPRLLSLHRPWSASLLLGIIWTFWHIPMIFLMPGAALPEFMAPGIWAILLYLVQITALTVIMTVVYIGTGGSVLLTLLLHLTFNTSESIFFRGLEAWPPDGQLRVIYCINVGLLAVVAIAAMMFVSGTKQTLFLREQ